MSKLTIHHKVEVNIQKQMFFVVLDLFVLFYFAIGSGFAFAEEHYLLSATRFLIAWFMLFKYVFMK